MSIRLQCGLTGVWLSGLYYEAAGDNAKAKEHITTAAEKHKIGHYMWDVARVHAERLGK